MSAVTIPAGPFSHLTGYVAIVTGAADGKKVDLSIGLQILALRAQRRVVVALVEGALRERLVRGDAGDADSVAGHPESGGSPSGDFAWTD